MQVINVVCGVWHTAAIAQEREGASTIPSSLAFLDFYSDGDALAEASGAINLVLYVAL